MSNHCSIIHGLLLSSLLLPSTYASADYSSTSSASNESCIRSFEQLVENVLSTTSSNDSDSNRFAISNAYYPPNEDESMIVDIQYSVGNNTHISFQWLDEEFLVPIDYDLLKALTFGVADLNRQQAKVFIDQFCDDNVEFIIEQLTILTTLLKSFSNLEDGKLIRGYALLKEVNGKRHSLALYSNAKINFLTALLVLISAAFNIVLLLLVHIRNTELPVSLVAAYDQSLKILNRVQKFAYANLNEFTSKQTNSNLKSVTDDCKKVLSLQELSEDLQGIVHKSGPATNLPQSITIWFILVFIAITILDFKNLTTIYYMHNTQSFFLLPMLWVLILIILDVPMSYAIQHFYAKHLEIDSEQKMQPTTGPIQTGIKVLVCIYRCMAVGCVTILPTYIIFHGVWIGILFITFPIRVIPSLVFISFLISGLRWIAASFILLISECMCYLMLTQDYPSCAANLKHRMKKVILQLINDESIKLHFPWISAEHLTSTTANQKRPWHEYRLKLILVGILVHVIILIIWITSQIGVYIFMDKIQDVSNISNNPLTTIIAALTISKLFSDVMDMLTPKFKAINILRNCTVVGISYVGLNVRCYACNEPIKSDKSSGHSGDTTLHDQPDESSSHLGDTTLHDQPDELSATSCSTIEETGNCIPSSIEMQIVTCGNCQLSQAETSKKLEAKVLIKSGANRVSVLLTEELITNLISSEERSAFVLHEVHDEKQKIKKRLLQTTPFDLKYIEGTAISMEKITNSGYQLVNNNIN